jgi:hypothetical protein
MKEREAISKLRHYFGRDPLQVMIKDGHVHFKLNTKPTDFIEGTTSFRITCATALRGYNQLSMITTVENLTNL